MNLDNNKRSLLENESPRKRSVYRQDNDNEGSPVAAITDSTIPSYDRLASKLQLVSDAIENINLQLKDMRKIDNSLSRFNDSFGAFLFGLSANGATVHYPKAPGKSDFAKVKTEGSKSTSILDATSNKSATKADASGKDTESAKRVVKFASKINIRKIIDRLPLKYREQTEHMKTMEIVLRALRSRPEGANMATLVEQVRLPKYRVTDCLNALVHSKDVLKYNPKGQLAIYKLDPVRYPSS